MSQIKTSRSPSSGGMQCLLGGFVSDSDLFSRARGAFFQLGPASVSPYMPDVSIHPAGAVARYNPFCVNNMWGL